MKVGIGCAGIGSCVTPEFVTTSAQAAEAAGFSSFWASEHTALFEQYDPPHDPANFSFRDPTLSFHDPLILLTWAAAVTKTISLGTAVALASQRQPIVFGKEVASLALLSGGRLVLGVGSGWAREEYAAIGVPFERRGARLEECVKAMRTLWRDRASTFHGEFVNFERAFSFPKPAGDDVPVLFGGDTDVMLKRVARVGDGWVPVRLSADQVRGGMTKIRRYADEYSRDASQLRVVAHMFLQTVEPDDLKRYRDIGVDEFVLSAHGRLPTDTVGLQDAVADLARRYVEPMM